MLHSTLRYHCVLFEARATPRQMGYAVRAHRRFLALSAFTISTTRTKYRPITFRISVSVAQFPKLRLLSTRNARNIALTISDRLTCDPVALAIRADSASSSPSTSSSARVARRVDSSFGTSDGATAAMVCTLATAALPGQSHFGRPPSAGIGFSLPHQRQMATVSETRSTAGIEAHLQFRILHSDKSVNHSLDAPASPGFGSCFPA